MASAATTKTLSMKLLIDTKTQRVLFAEAGKDVVDFLFSLLALPVATAVALIGKDSLAGSVGNLFSSVESLDDAYVLPGADKDALLRPTVSPTASSSSSLLLPAAPSSGVGGGGQLRALFRCSGIGGYSCSVYVTDVCGMRCPNCSSSMTKALPFRCVPPTGYGGGSVSYTFAGGGSASAGFVQGVVTYTVKDDLTITPMSAISSITLLNTFAVADLSTLREKTVQMGHAEGIQILRASLQSKTVLTDVFLGK